MTRLFCIIYRIIDTRDSFSPPEKFKFLILYEKFAPFTFSFLHVSTNKLQPILKINFCKLKIIQFPYSHFGTVNESIHNFASVLRNISATAGPAAGPRNTSSPNRRGAAEQQQPKRLKPVGFNVRDDGEGLANSGNKLAHVIGLANFNDRKAATRLHFCLEK